MTKPTDTSRSWLVTILFCILSLGSFTLAFFSYTVPTADMASWVGGIGLPAAFGIFFGALALVGRKRSISEIMRDISF